MMINVCDTENKVTVTISMTIMTVSMMTGHQKDNISLSDFYISTLEHITSWTDV